MDINMTSWHYRLINFFMVPVGNLCVYFWQLVASLTLFPILSLMWVPGYIVLRLTDLLLLSKEDTFQSMRDASDSKNVVWISLAGVASLIFIACMICFLTGKILFKIGDVHKTPTVSLVGTWLLAKKNKVCPLINFID